MPDGSATAHLYRPKLINLLQEGYGLASLRADAFAGLTVAIVDLPLSMAIAVASGVSPERGLYAAIIGGFIVSALGGSRYQIGGPAGAFIVLVSATVATHGLEGLLLAVIISGTLLTLVGIARLGSLIRYIPHAVTVGFTAGIAVTIFASQIKDIAGLRLSAAEPGPLLPKLTALAAAAGTVNFSAFALGVGTVAVVFMLARWTPKLPAMLIAVVLASLAVTALGLPVETIGSRFGGISQGLPMPSLPALDYEKVIGILPVALSFTLLGAVESLLSAKVADGMTGRRHRYNMELVAQGVANVTSALFGGISVTGTIARTATNIRAGGRTPVSGILHAAFLLIFVLVAAPLANSIPLAALAGVLVVVCWNMTEKTEFKKLLRNWETAAILLLTFALTVIFDLTYGIVAGCMLAAVLHVRQYYVRGGQSGH